MPQIIADNLGKDYRVAAKQPGLRGTIRHFFNRQYRTIHAVRNLSFRIERGEIVGFLGPNGAGKTTALKMLTGLVHPTQGQVRVVDHVPYQRRAEFLRQITLVMGQKQQLIWDLPAMDSLRINAGIYDIPPAQFKRRVEELSAMLGLSEELTQPVRKLSLGQRMKAELMAALLHEPGVLFLDEPTLGLDINAQAAVREFLRKYNAQHQATILLTSHYMADITALCPRVMLMHQGGLIYDGRLTELTERVSPQRVVSLEFAEPIRRDELATYGEVTEWDTASASILVHRDEVPRVVERLLNQFEVIDLTITDPPVESIIGQLYEEGVVA